MEDEEGVKLKEEEEEEAENREDSGGHSPTHRHVLNSTIHQADSVKHKATVAWLREPAPTSRQQNGHAHVHLCLYINDICIVTKARLKEI